jgi:hypothetical protein
MAGDVAFQNNKELNYGVQKYTVFGMRGRGENLGQT